MSFKEMLLTSFSRKDLRKIVERVVTTIETADNKDETKALDRIATQLGNAVDFLGDTNAEPGLTMEQFIMTLFELADQHENPKDWGM